ncbi:MAG: phosphotyrosine protein phosphatase [Pseudomonadota bacterium]
MTHVLFICGKNKWRSPTAEQIFSEHQGIECASAGLSNDAETAVSIELVEWADLIFVMEQIHKSKLSARFKDHLGSKRVISLGIPDNYKFMEPALVKLLLIKVTPYLPRTNTHR